MLRSWFSKKNETKDDIYKLSEIGTLSLLDIKIK